MQKSPTTRTIAPSTTGKPKPIAQLKLHQETIAGKKVVLVVADVESDRRHDSFADMTGLCMPTVSLLPISWLDFLKALPALDADIIFICSTSYGQDGFGTLRGDLKAFRGRNPKAVVALANAPLAHNPLQSLHSSNLLDHVDRHDVFSIPFLLKGVEVFVRRQELQ